MARKIPEAVREVCLSFPEAEEVVTHGSPDFKVRGKSFATFTLNHHGDGRVALWLHSPAGVQRLYTQLNPDAYFVPPYVGPRGWLGMELNKGLDWVEIASRVREAYENVAPASLSSAIGETIRIAQPVADMSPEEINPMLKQRTQEVLDQLAQRCSSLPETSTGEQFGNPVWKAGDKTFVWATLADRRLQLRFWVGIEQQEFFRSDHRFSIPAYMGHNGWIDLDVEDEINWSEIDNLMMNSYRHFALKRMLNALASQVAAAP